MDTSQFLRRKGRLVSKRRGTVDLVSPSYDWRERQRRAFRKALGRYAMAFDDRHGPTPTNVETKAANALAWAREHGFFANIPYLGVPPRPKPCLRVVQGRKPDDAVSTATDR